MLSLDELKQQIGAVQQERISLDVFEDWFRTNSRGAYAAEDRALSEAAASVEAAFSKYSFQEGDEEQLRQDLLIAISPFVQSPPAENSNGYPNQFPIPQSSAVNVSINVSIAA
jgi:hypothetical protein